MHETISLLDAPASKRLANLSQWYGSQPRQFIDFDIIDFPADAPWLGITKYGLDENGRYDFEQTMTIYEGSEIVNVLEIDTTGKHYSEIDRPSKDRWEAIFWMAIKSKEPVFGKTFAHGIGKEFINYEFCALPFINEAGLVSHVVLAISLI